MGVLYLCYSLSLFDSYVIMGVLEWKWIPWSDDIYF